MGQDVSVGEWIEGPDQWQGAIARMEAAGADAHAAIDRTLDLLRLGLQEYRDGGDRVSIVKQLIALGGIEARHAMEAACEELDRAVQGYRGAAVMVLVEEGGMTHSEVAALFGVSRPMVTRLYHTVSPPKDPLT